MRVRFTERCVLGDSHTLLLVGYQCRLLVVLDKVSYVGLLSPLCNIYKEKSPGFLLTIKILAPGLRDSTVQVYTYITELTRTGSLFTANIMLCMQLLNGVATLIKETVYLISSLCMRS